MPISSAFRKRRCRQASSVLEGVHCARFKSEVFPIHIADNADYAHIGINGYRTVFLEVGYYLAEVLGVVY